MPESSIRQNIREAGRALLYQRRNEPDRRNQIDNRRARLHRLLL